MANHPHNIEILGAKTTAEILKARLYSYRGLVISAERTKDAEVCGVYESEALDGCLFTGSFFECLAAIDEVVDEEEYDVGPEAT